MKIMIIGKGGREHALAWKFAQDKRVDQIFVIPGSNAIDHGKIKSFNLDSLNFKKLIAFAKKHQVDLTIVGSEKELAHGIVDAFQEANLSIFGPNKYCAQIEASKAFAKKKMDQFKIPNAQYRVFQSSRSALDYVQDKVHPVVIKIDGLAAGKGVIISHSIQESNQAINKMFVDYGQQHGFQIIIEEFLQGQEFSLLAFIKGKTISYMQTAQDYKRAYEHDRGPNTGGMGAYTPVKSLDSQDIAQGQEIIKKMVAGLADQGYEYCGIIYAGLMVTKDGVKALEFNVRFGDPEAEVLLLAMESSLLSIIESTMKYQSFNIKWYPDTFVGVVVASRGYPGTYDQNQVLNIEHQKDHLFFMGAQNQQQKIVAIGGRVALIYDQGSNLPQAVKNVYQRIAKMKLDNFFYRTDIGAINK